MLFLFRDKEQVVKKEEEEEEEKKKKRVERRKARKIYLKTVVVNFLAHQSSVDLFQVENDF
jgi:hypothetical protein